MWERKFTIVFKDGETQTVYAARGDQEDEEDGYVFFRATSGEITAMFRKSAIAEWYEED